LLFLDEPTAGVDPVSRREFWEQIHRLSSEGTTVLLTTHYMDEAERCHRLAFIFRGQVLDIGTPEQIIERRALQALELSTTRPREAAELLRRRPEVDEVAHYGHVLRLTTRGGVDPSAFTRELLHQHGIDVQSCAPSRVSVEDAFVSMVREDDASRAPRAA
jgi:ABC-2 type transport system ATP-binding protein